MLFIYKMYEPEVGHFCPYSIVSWDKCVSKMLNKHNRCPKTRFAINTFFWQMLPCFLFLGVKHNIHIKRVAFLTHEVGFFSFFLHIGHSAFLVFLSLEHVHPHIVAVLQH